MPRLRRIVRHGLIWGSPTLLVLVGVFLLLMRSGPGQRFLLERLLDVAEDRLQGGVTVAGIRSPSLLSRVTLLGVRIEDSEGRPFLEADSLGLRYSLLGLLRRDFTFSDLEVWQPRVTLERLPGQQEMNAVRIFSGGNASPSARNPGQTPERQAGRPGLDVRGVLIHRGEIRVRIPMEVGDVAPEAVLEEVPGGTVRTALFRDLEADLARVRVGVRGGVDEVLEARSLSFTGQVLAEPFRVRDFSGGVRREGSEITFDVTRLRLPASEFGGRAWLNWNDPEGLAISAALEATEVHLRDLRWFEPRLPDASGAFHMQLELRGPTAVWSLTGLDLVLEGSRIQGRLGVRTEEESFRLVDTELRPQPFDLSHLDPWLENPLPLEGRVRGRIFLDGPPGDLRVEGRLSLEESGAARPPSTARIDGTLHLGGAPLGVTDLTLELDPFYFGLAARLDERVALRGPGSVRLRADGRLGGTMGFDLQVAHRPPELPHSAIQIGGTVRGGGDSLHLDVSGRLEPLSFTTLAAAYPGLPVSGEATGTLQLRGPLSDLDIRTRLATPGGVLPLAGRLDLRNPGAGYRVEADLDDFELSTVAPALPGPTVLSGRALIMGRGLEPDSLEGVGEVELHRSRVGPLKVDSLIARFRAGAGTFHLDTITALTSAVDVEGAGTLALAEGVPSGEVELVITSDSLGGVRPFLLGDTVIAGDTLSALERTILEMEGVDPDTLPTEEAVRIDGRLRGRARLQGWVRDFSARGSLRVEEVVYGKSFLEGADLAFDVAGLPRPEARFQATLVADSLRVADRRFKGGRLAIDYTRPEGRVELLVLRNDDEDYRLRARVRADSLGGVVRLDTLTLRFEPVRWDLEGPASVSWDEEGVAVRDFRLSRPGEDPMRIVAEGRLPSRGPADFRLDIEDLSLARLSRLAQTGRDLDGTLGLRVRVGGSARAPVMDGTMEIRQLYLDGLGFSRVQGGVRYRDQAMTVGLLAWREEAVALTAEGSIPADLSFQKVERRFPDQELDLRMRIDSLPAAGVLTFLEALEDVRGLLDGEVRVAGTLQNPAPSGTVRLREGGARFPGLGISLNRTQGTFTLAPDGTIQVDVQGRSGGVAGVQGTILLDPTSDPQLDLKISARDFQGVDRRDVTATVGGEVVLDGTYRRPRLRGEVTVDQGILFLEEFARGAQVVDLSDPAFFDVVDTSLVGIRPLLAESRNPFLSNLRLDVNMVVERDSWIRSPDMNVELQGELAMVYDRTSRDLALVGQLQAIRGSYNAYGRRFEVRSGTVEFVGTPQLNPSLSIQAVTRLRRPSQEPLNIIANVRGTLVNPRVELTSDAQPAISQPDLVSYLIFGRPAGLLAPGERSVAGGAGQLLGGIASAGASLGLGTLTAQLSSAVAQEIGFFDYFAITTQQQSEVVGSSNPVAQTFTQSLASAQVELGRYFFEDVFVAVLLRPLTGLTGTERVSRPGVRVEWRFADLWTVEGFVEDRFARSRSTGFGDLGFRPEQALGLSLFREWGY